jgi:hypothetical protein
MRIWNWPSIYYAPDEGSGGDPGSGDGDESEGTGTSGSGDNGAGSEPSVPKHLIDTLVKAGLELEELSTREMQIIVALGERGDVFFNELAKAKDKLKQAREQAREHKEQLSTAEGLDEAVRQELAEAQVRLSSIAKADQVIDYLVEHGIFDKAVGAAIKQGSIEFAEAYKENIWDVRTNATEQVDPVIASMQAKLGTHNLNRELKKPGDQSAENKEGNSALSQAIERAGVLSDPREAFIQGEL